jgi:nitrogen-specific signal transduction histidine kinase
MFTIHNRTGIGLPLATELLSRMRGRIDYESVATRHDILLMLPVASV